jgi:hypothetical protein
MASADRQGVHHLRQRDCEVVGVLWLGAIVCGLAFDLALLFGLFRSGSGEEGRFPVTRSISAIRALTA